MRLRGGYVRLKGHSTRMTTQIAILMGLTDAQLVQTRRR